MGAGRGLGLGVGSDCHSGWLDMGLNTMFEAEVGRYPLIWLLWVIGAFVIAVVLVGLVLQALD
jgi:hypothetical protein